MVERLPLPRREGEPIKRDSAGTLLLQIASISRWLKLTESEDVYIVAQDTGRESGTGDEIVILN